MVIVGDYTIKSKGANWQLGVLMDNRLNFKNRIHHIVVFFNKNAFVTQGALATII